MTLDEGVFYEDLAVGKSVRHGLGRTVSDVDNIWFTLLTCNTNQIHFNADYAKKYFSSKPFKGRMAVNAFLVLSIVAGLSVNDTSRNGIMLGQRQLKLLHPVFSGDTLYAKTKVLRKRTSKSHKNLGVVDLRTEGFNQNGTRVIEFERTVMLRRRGKKWR